LWSGHSNKEWSILIIGRFDQIVVHGLNEMEGWEEIIVKNITACIRWVAIIQIMSPVREKYIVIELISRN